MVMSGVREMTLAEEIRNLADLGVDQNVIDRMTQKYNKMLTDHGNTCKIRIIIQNDQFWIMEIPVIRSERKYTER